MVQGGIHYIFFIYPKLIDYYYYSETKMNDCNVSDWCSHPNLIFIENVKIAKPEDTWSHLTSFFSLLFDSSIFLFSLAFNPSLCCVDHPTHHCFFFFLFLCTSPTFLLLHLHLLPSIYHPALPPWEQSTTLAFAGSAKAWAYNNLTAIAPIPSLVCPL